MLQTLADASWSVPRIGVAAGLILGAVLWLYRRLHRREEGFKALAALYRWSYSPDSHSMTRQWRGRPFGQGSERRATEVLTGNYRGCHFAAFTYSYELEPTADLALDAVSQPGQSGLTDSPSGAWPADQGAPRAARAAFSRQTPKRQCHYSVFVLTLLDHLPAIEFTPAGLPLPDRALGGRQVEFRPCAFTDAWQVTAGDPELAYGIVLEEFADWMMQPQRARVPMRFEGSDILTWLPGRLDIRRVVPELDALIEVRAMVPVAILNAYNRPQLVVVPGRSDPAPPVLLPVSRPSRPAATTQPPVPVQRRSVQPILPPVVLPSGPTALPAEFVAVPVALAPPWSVERPRPPVGQDRAPADASPATAAPAWAADSTAPMSPELAEVQPTQPTVAISVQAPSSLNTTQIDLPPELPEHRPGPLLHGPGTPPPAPQTRPNSLPVDIPPPPRPSVGRGPDQPAWHPPPRPSWTRPKLRRPPVD